MGAPPEADFYRLDERGRYRLAEPDPDGWDHSTALPGFRLQAEWLWQTPPPKILDALKEVGLLAP